jgi:hypothetical protein
MIFLTVIQAPFCPAHNCFVHMAEWATHVRHNHKDWIFMIKFDECSCVAEHVAFSCGLVLKQKAIDLQLPCEIEVPFRSYTMLPASLIHRCFQSLKCSLWQAQAKKLWPTWKVSAEASKRSMFLFGEPCWTYWGSTLCGASHVLLLPPNWNGTSDNKEPAELSRVPSLDHTVHSVSSRTACQDWPLRLGWMVTSP